MTDHNWINAYLRVLYRHRLPAALALITVVAAAGAYLFLAERVFEARAQLLIQVETPEVIDFRNAPDAREQLTTDDYQTQYGILRSRSLARRTIESLQLWNHDELGAASQSRVAKWLGRTDATEHTPEAGETGLQTRVINNFLSRLTVDPVTNSRLVDVKFRSNNPELAASVTNTLARGYIDQNVESRFETAKTAGAWLEQQLSEQRGRLASGQQNLQRYRESNPGAGVDSAGNIVVQKLADLNGAVTRAETLRIEKQSAFERLRRMASNRDALDGFPAILANTFIQTLKTQLAEFQRERQQVAQRFGDRHPDMLKLNQSIESAQTRLNAEIAKVVQAVENEYLAAQAQEQRLLAELSQQQRATLAQDRKSIDYGVLEREVVSNQQLFDSLLQRAKELGIAGDFKSTNVSIVDRAEVPQVPVWPAPLQTLALAMAVGVLLSGGTAMALERLDSRIKSPADITALLRLPFLGLVPEIASGLTSSSSLRVASGNAPAILSNAFDDLSTNLMVRMHGDGPRTVMVCSAAPGEGKTLVASNLAITLADMGLRVLLVDIDTRRPRVHEVFEIDKAPGLTDVLAGTRQLQDAVKRSGAGPWVLPAGRTPKNFTAVLGSKQGFSPLLAELAGTYDWVILDSPPVLAVADSTLVAGDVSGVLMVVNTRTTKRNAAHLAIERLDAAGARFFGAVLNRADIEKHGFYFDPYYRKEYTAYYAKPAAAATAHPQEGAANAAVSVVTLR